MPFTIVLRLQNMSCFDGSLSPTSKHLTNSKLRGLTLGPSAPIPGLGNSKHPTQPNPTGAICASKNTIHCHARSKLFGVSPASMKKQPVARLPPRERLIDIHQN